MTRRPAWSLPLLLTVAACSGSGDPTASASAAEATAPTPAAAAAGVANDWYRPAVDTTWQWQLLGDVNTEYEVDVYDVDLFDTPTDVIASLRNEGRIVICYFSAGSYEEWREDAAAFDAEVRGEPLEGWEGERWLDIRAAGVREIMAARLDLAVSKGCDGVEPDNVDGYTNDTGFDFAAADQLTFDRWLADEAHRRSLAIGLKNSGDQAAELVDWFDFSLNEQCHEFDECDQLAPFLEHGKPVWNAEYVEPDEKATAQAHGEALCPQARAENIRTLILPLELDDSFRVSCDEW